VRNHTIKGLALAAGALLVAVALSASANAATLRRGSSTGSASVSGTLPGSVLWTYYDTCNQFGRDSACTTFGNGDNIIRLINPNGSGNSGISGETDTPVCAMVYVFDDEEEMVECCGCPITSVGLLTLSVNDNLLTDPITGGNPNQVEEGSIAIVATLPTSGTDGCAPGNTPGYTPSAAVANLLGSITHNLAIGANSGGSTSGLTEIGLFDDANGDAANVSYLQNECSNLVGNGTHHGICTCGFGA